MRMKNRFCRMGKSLLGAVCLLSTCGVTYSCSDDYDLPDTKPSFLGESIYDELKNRQDLKFTTVIRLIDDLGQKDVLSKTGSKTIFVADDDAYAKFFANNNWTDGNGNPVDSYEKLSTNQKRLLLYGSMLNNAYVLENLTTMQGPVKNVCLRQISASSATDSIPYWRWDELPNNLNTGQKKENGTVENADTRFWDTYRKQSVGGIWMALDGTDPQMTHFLEAQLKEKDIKHSDISFILNLDGTENAWTDDDTENRSYIYNSKIIEQDVTCLNGYYNVLDTVMVAPSNMAEIIRTNGDTKLFSEMLDRFSAPYYDENLTQQYKALHTIEADSIFKKIYISQRSSLGSVTTGPDKKSLGDFPSLSYDPGWNAYTVNNLTKEQDMAAMFVPCDAAMTKYFVDGGGKVLIERYGDMDNTEANLLHNLYQIPLNIIKPLIANLMKESFNESVPSKYLTIMNDAQDPMFESTSYPSVADYKAEFKRVILANNGVVYIMKDVISPATYASVMAPVLYDTNTQVVNTVVHADENYTTTNYANAPLRKFYNTYLLAMQSSFSFFVPTDEGLLNYGYVDPIGMSNIGLKNNYRYWTFEPSAITTSTSGKYVAVTARSYQYDPDKGMNPATDKRNGSQLSLANQDLSDGWGVTKKSLLCEMIDHHIIVHDNDDNEGVRGSRNYYLSRNGAPVFVKKRGSNSEGLGMQVEGGLQIDLNSDDVAENDFEPTVTKVYDMSRATNNYGNGMTYYLDRPMQATTNTVYAVLQNHDNFSKFFELCNSISSNTGSQLLVTLFRDSTMNEKTWQQEQNKYYIFAVNGNSQSTVGARYTARNMRLVRFFNAYRYSVYVPNNEAIERAIANGLPTIETIDAYIEANKDENDKISDEVKTKAQAMLNLLINFLKYHFADQSLFVDNCTEQTTCQSACSQEDGSFVQMTVNQTPGAITITDETNTKHSVVTTDAKEYNICARDFELDNAPASAREIKNSSYVAVHSLGNDYLNFSDAVKNGFSQAYSTLSKAKAFNKKYSIQK